MEIVTWVLRGSLVHQDSTGHSGVIYPGLAQRMSDAGAASPATLLAMGALIGNLLERQQQAREAFDPVFAEFQDGANQRAFRSLFRPVRTSVRTASK
jgi:hypothetical protein